MDHVLPRVTIDGHQLSDAGMSLTYKVTTEPSPNGVIVQSVDIDADCEAFISPLDKVTKWIIDTRDKQIRDALIALGWTPPR